MERPDGLAKGLQKTDGIGHGIPAEESASQLSC